MTRAFNMDCMEAMKQFPDKYFDLAVVDPPYGDALNTHTHTATDGIALENDLTDTNIRQTFVNRGGWHGKNPYYLGTQTGSELPQNQTGRGVSRTGGTWARKYAKKLLRGT